jgi:hypothetical protein
MYVVERSGNLSSASVVSLSSGSWRQMTLLQAVHCHVALTGFQALSAWLQKHTGEGALVACLAK